jgi:hypothetical protein
MKRKNRDIKPASSIFPGAVPGRRWKIFFPRRIIWQKWEEIVGEVVSKNAWPWYFRDVDCLVVAVSDNIWMQQLTYQKTFILEKLNEDLPQGSKLKDLRFFLGDVSEVRKKNVLRSQKKGAVQRQQLHKKHCDDAGSISETQVLLENIQDEKLRIALLSLIEKAG